MAVGRGAQSLASLSLNPQGTQQPHGSVEDLEVTCLETLTQASLVAGGRRGVVILLPVAGKDESGSGRRGRYRPRAWGREPGAQQHLEPELLKVDRTYHDGYSPAPAARPLGHSGTWDGMPGPDFSPARR